MTTPLLSINIPTYNRRAYLQEALEALLPQLTDDVEINVSDNHSTDDTWAYLETLNGQVNRIRPAPGTNGNFNILSCLTLGRGEYTWIHCDDDIARLNAVENIIRGIRAFNNPPVVSFHWDGFDKDMTGFVNRRVKARWKRCDRNEFLLSISYRFTFASAIVVRRGCADIDYIQSHAPLSLIPGNIIFSTVGKHNDAIVSEDCLLAGRGNPSSYDGLTVFSKQLFQLFRMNQSLGYDPAVLKQVYSDSLKTVIAFTARSMPLTGMGLWNVTACSVGYKNFYLHVLPPLVSRLLPNTTRVVRFGRKCVARCLSTLRRWIGSLARWLIVRILSEAANSISDPKGAADYSRICKSLDEIAMKYFDSQVFELKGPTDLQHPVYFRNAQYFRIGTGFSAGPGLRMEAWDAFEGEAYHPQILIGNNVVLNLNVHLGAIDRIEIHDNVLIGSNVLITDHCHGSMTAADSLQPPRLRPLSSKGPVIIEEDVWIGENVAILPNVSIGKGAVVGANAVVTKDVPANAIVGGNPARVLRMLR